MPDTLASSLAAPPLERIRRERRALSWRRSALALCEAEVAHARSDFWQLAHALRLEGAFDRFLDPAWHEAAALPHERKAGRVLLWLTHLQVEEQEIARAIGMGMLRSDRRYLRGLFKRRLALKQGLRQTFAQYRRLRPLAA